ncbi:MAG: hypothetical protein WC764_04135 [Candidatus Paceibacterota bacterium]|jgi:hypothetical protein
MKSKYILLIAVLVILGYVLFADKKVTPPVDLGDFRNVKLVYTEDNGSVPPPYYTKNILTLSFPANGGAVGELTVNDYKGNVTKKQDVIVTEDQFKQVVGKAMLISKTEKDLGGCTGGSNQSVEVSRNDNVLLDVGNYNCANSSSNKGVNDFSTKLKQIIKN